MKYVFGELLLAGTHENENENAQSVRDGSFVGQMPEGEEDWEREDETTTRAVGKDHMKSVLEELLRVETHEKRGRSSLEAASALSSHATTVG
jgi:hypothetical protein